MNTDLPSQTPAAVPDRPVFWSWPGLLDEASRVCYYLVHLTWLAPWIFSLLRYNHPGSETLAFFLLLVVTYSADGLARGMAYYRLKASVRRIALGGYVLASLIIVLGGWSLFAPNAPEQGGAQGFLRSILDFSHFSPAIPGEFLISVFVLFNILHGVRQAQEFIGPPSFLKGMLWGVLGFVAFGLVISRVTGADISAWFFLFITSLVTGLYLYRMGGFLLRSKSGQRITSHRWRIGVLAGVFLFLWIGGLISSIIGEYLPQLRTFLGAAGLNLLYVISLPFLGILALFEAVMGPYIGTITMPDPPPLFQNFRLPEIPVRDGPDALDALVAMIGNAIKPFVLWGILILVTAAILRMALFSKQPPVSKADFFESLAEGEDIPKFLAKNLRGQLAAMLGRFSRIGERRRRQRAAARVRQIYSAWLSICAENGVARLEAQTPAEHAEIAAGVFPTLRAEIAVLVNTYHRVRYGEYPELPEELKSVEQAWIRLRRV